MIKINIKTLEGELSIELKPNEAQYDLIVIMSKSEYFEENGRGWYAKTTEKQSIDEILYLIKRCHENPSLAKNRTISDGIITKINFGRIHLILQDIDNGTIESELIQKIFVSTLNLIKDPILEKYTFHFGYIK